MSSGGSTAKRGAAELICPSVTASWLFRTTLMLTFAGLADPVVAMARANSKG